MFCRIVFCSNDDNDDCRSRCERQRVRQRGTETERGREIHTERHRKKGREIF